MCVECQPHGQLLVTSPPGCGVCPLCLWLFAFGLPLAKSERSHFLGSFFLGLRVPTTTKALTISHPGSHNTQTHNTHQTATHKHTKKQHSKTDHQLQTQNGSDTFYRLHVPRAHDVAQSWPHSGVVSTPAEVGLTEHGAVCLRVVASSTAWLQPRSSLLTDTSTARLPLPHCHTATTNTTNTTTGPADWSGAHQPL